VKQIKVGARIIAATNRDVVAEIRQGTFRADLFYRLEALSICLPPLRERQEDIPELVRSFLQLLGSELNIWPIPQLDCHGMQAALDYSWPGNVRELRNLLQRCLTFSHGAVEQMNAHFVEDINNRSKRIPEVPPESGNCDTPPIIEELVRQAAGKRIRNPSAEQKRRLLEECVVQGSMKQAEISKRLGVSPSTACKWLKSIAGAVTESQETPLSDETPITGQLPN
jgi:transcriptional regulator with PAS, ATPase and Fis domain